ncbi:hypothetical protein HYW54_00775 [Candidatus Gottesmanbacteria bacterium]|nr:hypothetical protein [Candidatus Gottesmanbacteria bacterium]
MVLNFLKKIGLFIILLFIFAKPALSKEPTFLIINQVRGDESCCQNGSTDILKTISKDKEIQTLPTAWALRFDALNERYISPIKDDELGLLLEITPSLASASGVDYKGFPDGSNWNSAKNTFLIGYTIEERKKLIDTLFTKYKNIFGTYPEFTVAWMIDAWSLNYIHDIYGVNLHELTKEQYETDSYTLYGGMFNLPYYPSKNHPLLPGYDEDKLDIIIVRQTISDILKNYGSSKAYFTSQPNDYLSNPKAEKNYFEKLVKEIVKQNDGFGLIGFENSFSWDDYGKEYMRQLNYLKDLREKEKIAILPISKFIEIFQFQNSQNPSRTLENNSVFWYFSKTYRARVIKKEDHWILDDLRIYANLNDPYKENPARLDFAYWIVPYILDNSQFNFGISLDKTNIDTKVHFGPHSITIAKSRNPSFTNGMLFADLLKKRKKVTLSFPRHPKLFLNPTSGYIEMGWDINGNEIPFLQILDKKDSFELIPGIKNQNLLSNLDFLFQPDKSPLEMDPKKTIVYWNNTKAIAGRNPIRIFILPRNKFSRATQVEKVDIKGNGLSFQNFSYPTDYSYRISPWFIDISSDKSINTEIYISLDGKILAKNIPIFFAPDCQYNIKSCLLNPANLLSYIDALFDEKKRSILEFLKTRR